MDGYYIFSIFFPKKRQSIWRAMKNRIFRNKSIDNKPVKQNVIQKIVCHSDNLIDNCRRQKIESQIDKALKDGYKEYAIRLANLHKELSNICGIDLNEI